MVVFFCFGLDLALGPGCVSALSLSKSRFGCGMKSHVFGISDERFEFSAGEESRLELWDVDKSWVRYPRRPLALAHKVTTRFLTEPTSAAEPSKAAVVGVRNDVLLRFCFGPEAAGVSFRFGGMGRNCVECFYYVITS